jgi:type IV pilus assembly protein PilV
MTQTNQVHHTPAARQRGFTMVEVLVALVVLCVGLLGMASLYIVTLRTSGGAIYRMQAVNLASDLGDRIRANPTAGTAYAGDPASTAGTCAGAAKNCSPEEMAAHDLRDWQDLIASTLPGSPTGTVTVNTSTTPWTYEIAITWVEAGDTEENRQQYVMRMQL